MNLLLFSWTLVPSRLPRPLMIQIRLPCITFCLVPVDKLVCPSPPQSIFVMRAPGAFLIRTDARKAGITAPSPHVPICPIPIVAIAVPGRPPVFQPTVPSTICLPTGLPLPTLRHPAVCPSLPFPGLAPLAFALFGPDALRPFSLAPLLRIKVARRSREYHRRVASFTVRITSSPVPRFKLPSIALAILPSIALAFRVWIAPRRIAFGGLRVLALVPLVLMLPVTFSPAVIVPTTVHATP